MELFSSFCILLFFLAAVTGVTAIAVTLIFFRKTEDAFLTISKRGLQFGSIALMLTLIISIISGGAFGQEPGENLFSFIPLIVMLVGIAVGSGMVIKSKHVSTKNTDEN